MQTKRLQSAVDAYRMARGHIFLLLGAWVWHIILYKLCYCNPILIGESISFK